MNNENYTMPSFDLEYDSKSKDKSMSREMGKIVGEHSKNDELVGEICGIKDVKIDKLYGIIDYIGGSLGEEPWQGYGSTYIDGILKIINKARRYAEEDGSVINKLDDVENGELPEDWEITNIYGDKKNDRVYKDIIFDSWIWADKDKIGREGIRDQDEEWQYIIINQDNSSINIQSVICEERGLYEDDEHGRARIADLSDWQSYYKKSAKKQFDFTMPPEFLYRAVEDSLEEANRTAGFSTKEEYAKYLTERL